MTDGYCLGGFRFHVIDHLPRTPVSGLKEQPWWLTDAAHAEHQRWCGEFFGWQSHIYVMPEAGIGFASPDVAALIREVIDNG